MTESTAGGVQISFSGDANQLLAEIKRLTGSLKEVETKAQATSAKVSSVGAAGGGGAGLSKIQQTVAGAASAMGALGAATGSTSNKMGQAATAAAAMGGAFVAGGAIAAGVAVVGLLAQKYMDAKKAAEEMRAAALAANVEGGRAVQEGIGGLMTSAAGLTGEQAKAQDEVNYQLVRQGDLLGRLADYDTDRLERFREYAAEGKTVSESMRRDIAAYDELGTQLDEVTSALSGAEGDLSRISELQKTIKANAEAEAAARERSKRALDLEYSTLIRKLDTEKAALSVDLELSDTRDPVAEAAQAQYEADVLAETIAGVAKVWDEHGKNVAKRDLLEADAIKDRIRVTQESIAAMEDEAKARREDTAAMAGNIASAAVTGNLGSALGGMAGSALGALAPTVGIPVDPATGAAIGGVLGQMLGGLIDSLAPVMEIVQILLDSVGGLIGELTPIFEPLVGVAGFIATILKVMGPSVGAIAGVVGGLLEVFSTLLVALEPLLLAYADVLTDLIDGGPITVLIKLFGELARHVRNFGDVIANIAQAITGAQWDLNSTMDANNAPTGPTAGDPEAEAYSAAWYGDLDGNGVMGDINDVAMYQEQNPLDLFALFSDPLDENTEALREATKGIANLPKGWKKELAAYEAQNPVADAPVAGGGSSGTSSGSTTIVQIGDTMVARLNDRSSRIAALRRRGVARNPSPPPGDP